MLSKVASNIITVISSDMPKILLGGDGQTLLPHPAPAATATAGHIAGEAAMAKEESKEWRVAAPQSSWLVTAPGALGVGLQYFLLVGR